MRLAKTGEGKERYFITISQDNSLKIKSSFYQIPQEYLRQFLDYFWDYDESNEDSKHWEEDIGPARGTAFGSFVGTPTNNDS